MAVAIITAFVGVVIVQRSIAGIVMNATYGSRFVLRQCSHLAILSFAMFHYNEESEEHPASDFQE